MESPQLIRFLPRIVFSVVNDIQASATTFSNDLTVRSNLVFQWKMIFNADLTKQVQQVVYSRRTKKLLIQTLAFNSISLKNCMFQKNLGLTLDIMLKVWEQIKNNVITKILPYWHVIFSQPTLSSGQ